ncbi:MAG TPA: KpsF/GutQ family sugar-phosphate isomerase [Gemmatimonadaceae bacterium]
MITERELPATGAHGAQLDAAREPCAHVDVARDALLCEARAIERAAERLDGSLTRAVQLLIDHDGKVVVTGVGKSGHIGQKIASTFCSTGTPSVFLHAGEAAHGDLGVCARGDPTILISKSGTTPELLRLLPMLRDIGAPLIAIVGNLASPLARRVDVVLDASVAREADALDLAPTCSSTVALALGDALAVALMQARHFSDRDFARNHPGGQLGRNLWLHVASVMHQGDAVAWVSPDDSLRDVVIAMTEHPLGAACVIGRAARLAGIVTDGDIRRALRMHEDIRSLTAADVMVRNPITVRPTATLGEAARQMEDRPSQIAVLPVVSEDDRCLGVLRLHDIYQASMS